MSSERGLQRVGMISAMREIGKMMGYYSVRHQHAREHKAGLRSIGMHGMSDQELMAKWPIERVGQ